MKQFILIFIFGVFGLAANAQAITVSYSVTAPDDDAEESQDGTDISQSSSDLELVFDDGGNQTVGIRFLDVDVPPGSIIENAYIQFTAEEDGNTATNLIVRGHMSTFSTTFTNEINNISGRSMTTSQAIWDNVPSWNDNDAGFAQRSPDLSEVVTEIITSNHWQQGNPLTFIITGTGERSAYSYNGNISFAPQLVISYLPNIDTDLGISMINQPEALMHPIPNARVEVEISNFGLDPQSDYEVSYSINGGVAVKETVSQSINTGESYIHTFSQNTDLTILGNYQIRAEVVVPNDEISANNVIIKNFEVVPLISELFFSSGSPWKYLDDGSNQGTAWQQLGYDDSAWSIGQGHFGFGDNDETTYLEAGSITYYFRKKVNISDVSLLDNIYLNLVHDDAAIVHINEVEVLRTDLLPSGTIGYLTDAIDGIPSDVENVLRPYMISKSAFQNGDNIIAIEIHNSSASNLDLSFDCNIVDEIIYQLDGPYVFYRNGQIVVKTIEEIGPQTITYQDPTDVVLTCRFPNGLDFFNVELKPQLVVESSVYDLPHKFLATSDIEGDLEAFAFLLIDAGVMDDDYNWVFGSGHLAISGDLFDRGNKVNECLWLLYRLESQAIAQGGKINFVLGNHDMSNLTADFEHTHLKYGVNAVLMDETLETLYAKDTELGRWLRTKNIVERLGPFIFIHGGISPEMAALNLSYDAINNRGRLLMNDNCATSICETIDGSSGIYWDRGMARELYTQEEVDNAISAFDGKRVVIGHTILDNISLFYNNKVIGIDLDHPVNFENGFMKALYYEDFELFEFFTDGNNQIYTLIDAVTSNNNTIESEPHMTVMPNPSNGNFHITVNGVDDWINLKVLNLQSKILLEKRVLPTQMTYSDNIDLTELPKGIYFLQLESNQSSLTKRLVKE